MTRPGRPADPDLPRDRRAAVASPRPTRRGSPRRSTRSLEAGFRAVDLGDWVARGRPDGRPRVRPGVRRRPAVDPRRRRRRWPGTASRRRSSSSPTGSGRDNAWPGQPRGDPASSRLLAWSDLDAPGRGRVPVRLARADARAGSTGCDDARARRRAARLARRDRAAARAAPAGSWPIPTGASTARVRRRGARGTSTRRSGPGSTTPTAGAGPVRPRPDRRLLPPLAAARSTRSSPAAGAGWLRGRRALRAVRRGRPASALRGVREGRCRD